MDNFDRVIIILLFVFVVLLVIIGIHEQDTLEARVTALEVQVEKEPKP